MRCSATAHTRARAGCLLMLAALCFAEMARAQGSHNPLSSDTHEMDISAFATENTLRGRQLMQGADVFNGGPGADGGNGGLAETAQSPAVDGNAGAGGTGNAGSGGGGGGGGGGSIGGLGGVPLPRPTCGFGEYVLRNKCTKCVSRLPTASTEILRGKKCAKPFGANSPTSCNFGDLSGLQIGKTEDPLTVSTCIDSTRDVVTVYVPRPGFYFFGVTTNKYIFDSISLAGAPLLPVAGIPSNYNYIQTVNGIEVDALVFTGTSAILQKAKGKRVAINGIVNVAGNFDLCFAATAEVCS